MTKNTIKTVVMIILFWLIIPTGDPSDLITFWLIASIGFNAYFILSVVVIVVLYKTIEGKTIKDKINTVKKEIKKIIK